MLKLVITAAALAVTLWLAFGQPAAAAEGSKPQPASANLGLTAPER